jgi:hypothetical protein
MFQNEKHNWGVAAQKKTPETSPKKNPSSLMGAGRSGRGVWVVFKVAGMTQGRYSGPPLSDTGTGFRKRSRGAGTDLRTVTALSGPQLLLAPAGPSDCEEQSLSRVQLGPGNVPGSPGGRRARAERPRKLCFKLKFRRDPFSS